MTRHHAHPPRGLSESAAWREVQRRLDAIRAAVAPLAHAVDPDARKVRTAVVDHALAALQYVRAMLGQVGAGVHRNPPLAMFLNPPPGRGHIMSREVVAIRYCHADDGEYYQHDFTTPVSMVAMPDGSLVIRSLDGKSLHDDFP